MGVEKLRVENVAIYFLNFYNDYSWKKRRHQQKRDCWNFPNDYLKIKKQQNNCLVFYKSVFQSI